MKNFCKALILSLIFVAPAFAQHPQVIDINYGNGNIVKETSGNGAPADVCTGLLKYVQKDATAGQNEWRCISGHMVQQGASTTSIPATASTFGTVKLATGQSATTLAKVGTTGVYSDLSGIPTIPVTCQVSYGDGLNAITAGAYPVSQCFNTFGTAVTITSIKCYSDAGSPTLAATNGAGTALLASAITCAATPAAGTQSGTTTIAAGDNVKFTFTVSGTATKQATFIITGTR